MKIPKDAKTKTEVVEVLAKINVTQEDINKGVQGKINTCAVARSLKRHFNENNVSVADDEIKVDGYTAEKVPVTVANFIGKFDDDKKIVKPFSFVLKLVRNY